MNSKAKNFIPADGLLGLKQNFSTDAVSGFIVFLLALPLSLGIAKASDFPPIMGLITAIIGGLLVSLISGSRLTIKGPAAGLIVIVAGSVAEFGNGDAILGWKLALGAMFIAALIQVLFGLLKLGRFVDFFPISAIRGMLAAIGIIIIAKQIPVLLNNNPALVVGKSPLELLANIPIFVLNANYKVTIIGFICLLIMLSWPHINNKYVKMFPVPLIVLFIAIPSGLLMDFAHLEPSYTLVKIGNLVDNINLNLSFEGVSQTRTFIKYVIMFALVGTIESLLTVKAIDLVDPFKRKSNANKDLIAIGVGNVFASLLGGLPMISEVARSSSNVNNGGKTRWANFFHGFFILAFLLLASPLLEMIPNTALAAMLITVGIKLAHPREFIQTYKIGKEQLLISLVTIFFTLYEDLLVGVAVGIVLNIIIHFINGAPISSLFHASIDLYFEKNNYYLKISKSAIFSNYLGIKNKLEAIPYGFIITIDLSKTKLVDHSVMENLEIFKHDYELNGGTIVIIGLENHIPLSNHPLASRKSS